MHSKMFYLQIPGHKPHKSVDGLRLHMVTWYSNTYFMVVHDSDDNSFMSVFIYDLYVHSRVD